MVVMMTFGGPHDDDDDDDDDDVELGITSCLTFILGILKI